MNNATYQYFISKGIDRDRAHKAALILGREMITGIINRSPEEENLIWNILNEIFQKQ